MERYRYRSRKHNPSFSSTLLDMIYQSFDATDVDHDHHQPVVFRNTTNRQSIDACFSKPDKQVTDSRGGSKNISDDVFQLQSATGFETEGNNISYSCSRLRPLRTSINEDNELNTREINRNIINDRKLQQEDQLQPRDHNGVKTKSRATKIYRYLTKGKHPMTPGGRFARFVVSLFSTTNAKKPKNSSLDDAIVHANRKPKSVAKVSTGLTNSRRSCLNECPASVNINSQPRGHRSVNKEEVKMHLTEKNLQIQTGRSLLKNYQKVGYVFDSIKNNYKNDYDDYDDDDDEAASYASSDLFELDHLSAIGMDRCMQELPLYETTSVDANRAIANGLLD